MQIIIGFFFVVFLIFLSFGSVEACDWRNCLLVGGGGI